MSKIHWILVWTLYWSRSYPGPGTPPWPDILSLYTPQPSASEQSLMLNLAKRSHFYTPMHVGKMFLSTVAMLITARNTFWRAEYIL